MKLKEIKSLKLAQLFSLYGVLNYAINLINRHMFVMDALLEMDVKEKNIITMQMMHKPHIMTD